MNKSIKLAALTSVLALASVLAHAQPVNATANSSTSSQSNSSAQGGAGGGGGTGYGGGGGSAAGGSATVGATTSGNNQSFSPTIQFNTPDQQTINQNQTISGTTTQNQNVTSNGTQNVNQNVTGTTTNNQNVVTRNEGSTSSTNWNGGYVIQEITGTQTIKNVPSMNAPPLTTSNDTCMGSSSGSGAGPGWGVSFGTTWTDENCKRLKNGREMWNMGLKGAGLALLCQDAANRQAIKDSWTNDADYLCPQDAAERKRAAAAPAAPVAQNGNQGAAQTASTSAAGWNTSDPYIAMRAPK